MTKIKVTLSICVKKYQKLSDRIVKNCENLSKNVKNYQNLSRFGQIYQYLSTFIKRYQTLSKYCLLQMNCDRCNKRRQQEVVKTGKVSGRHSFNQA